MLSVKNYHPKDKELTFIEETHVYTVNGKTYTSVTTVIHNFFPQFNSDLVIDRMMSSSKFQLGPYKGMTKNEIKNKWEINRIEASNAGTIMHKDIESFINNEPVKNPNVKEFHYFMNFWNEVVIDNFKPYRTEWMIHSKDGIAGSIDCVLVNEDDQLVLLDWKRSKEIKKTNPWEKGFGPFKDLDNCNYNHYKLQLNIYKYILEKEYGKTVVGMFNIILHPNQENYQIIQIENINVDMFWKNITKTQ